MTCYIIQYCSNTFACVHHEKGVNKSLIIDICINNIFIFIIFQHLNDEIRCLNLCGFTIYVSWCSSVVFKLIDRW